MKNSHRHLYEPSPIFSGVKRWANFDQIFDPTRISSALILKYIKNLENTENAPMIDNGQESFPIFSPIFTGGGSKKTILPNFTLSGALVSERSNRSKI